MFKNLKSKFAKWLTGYDADLIKAHNTVMQQSIGIQQAGLTDNYLFDFKNWSSGYANGGNVLTGTVMIGSPDATDKTQPTKIKVKPIDVLNELETVPTPFSLALIDEKIEILKDKAKLITQNYSKREIEALQVRLENRKKYSEHKEFFDAFQNTTDEKIDLLLEKYDLLMKTSDIFVPEFPDEAIKVMKEYDEKMEVICGKKAVFYVIATEDKFRKAYQKRDPILLVQSPFGFYWQILGAWDKEMLLLSEL